MALGDCQMLCELINTRPFWELRYEGVIAHWTEILIGNVQVRLLKRRQDKRLFPGLSKTARLKRKIDWLVYNWQQMSSNWVTTDVGTGSSWHDFLAPFSMNVRTWSCVRDLKLVSRPSTYTLCSSARGSDWDCADWSAWDQFIFSIFCPKKLPKSLASWSGLPGGKETSLALHNKA